MELDIELNLAEAAMQLDTSVEKLIQIGAHGDLTISVVANDWPVHTESETAETITGLVNLVPSDLLQSYVAEFVLVHKVVTANDNETVTLAEPVEVLRGLLYVTAEEFRRFRDKHGSAAGRTEGIPPYLDSSHSLKSPQLKIAIEAWSALFASGEFDPKGRAVKYRIEQWLAKNHGELSTNARENIATLINPEIYKDGGTPRTPDTKT
jgi:hypothetical protein